MHQPTPLYGKKNRPPLALTTTCANYTFVQETKALHCRAFSFMDEQQEISRYLH
jgi:hypothetical protein